MTRFWLVLDCLLLGLLLALGLLLGLAGVSEAACTGTSPQLSAPDTGSATTNGADFADCLHAALLGDTITLTAGAVYQGSFTLPDKGSGTAPIIVQSSKMADLPAGVRVTPAQAPSMARLTTDTTSAAVIFAGGAHHWILRGLEVTQTGSPYARQQNTPNLITNGQPGGGYPHDLVFDRMLVHPHETDPLPFRSTAQGFALDGVRITIERSAIWDFMGWESPTPSGITVLAATNASPVAVTLSSSPGFKSNGKRVVTFAGGTGAWAALNRTLLATKVDDTHATLQLYDPETFALTDLDGTGFGPLTGTPALQNQWVTTSFGILIIAGPGPYTITDNFVETYYSQLFTGGGSGTAIDPQNVVTVTAVPAMDKVVLSSLGQLEVGDLMAFSTMCQEPVTGATNGNPTILTVAPHRYPAGMSFGHDSNEGPYFTGATGAWAPLNSPPGVNSWGIANGARATIIDATHLSIPVDSTTWGPLTGTITWTYHSKQYSQSPKGWSVGKVTAIDPATRTVTFAYQGNTKGGGGNGAGIAVAVGATAQFRGLNIDGLTVERNTFSVRRNWIWLIRDVARTCDSCNDQPPKAMWESKTATHVVFQGNTIQVAGGDLVPYSGSVGLALNQANQIGATPWIVNSHWRVDSNLFKNYVYHKVSLTEEYLSGTAGTDFVFSNNLMTHAFGAAITLEGTDHVSIVHNTWRNMPGSSWNYNSFVVKIADPNPNAIIRDNVGRLISYGYSDQTGTGWAGVTRDHNFLTDDSNSQLTLPPSDTKVSTDAAMHFANLADADAGGDYHGYRLLETSPGHHAASDGTDVGVDFATLDDALGTPPPTTTGCVP